MKIRNIIATSLLGLTSIVGLSSLFINKTNKPVITKAEDEVTMKRTYVGVDQYGQMDNADQYLNAEGVKAVVWCFSGDFSLTESNGELFDITVIGPRLGITDLPVNLPKSRIFRTPISTPAGITSLDGVTIYNLCSKDLIRDATDSPNTIRVVHWDYADYSLGMRDEKFKFMPSGTTVTLDLTECDINWLDAYATHYFVSYCYFEYLFGYTSIFVKMEFDTTLNKLVATTSQDIWCTGIIFTRNDPNGPQYSWDSKWNQTTNQDDVESSCNFKMLEGKFGDNYNCASVDDIERTEIYAQKILDKFTCTGQTRSFSNEDWVYFFFDLQYESYSFRDLLKSSVAKENSTYLREVALYRYDYVVFYKDYGLYDYMDRGSSPNRAFLSKTTSTDGVSSDLRSDNTPMLIVVAAIATLSLTTLLIIKKKKSR